MKTLNNKKNGLNNDSDLVKHWYVYILKCADNTFYTGITTDLNRRVKEHNRDNKLGAKYTRARRPVELTYSETLTSRKEAGKREAELKNLSRSQKHRVVLG